MKDEIMNIEHRSITELKKASCCNEYKCEFYRLSGWLKNVWYCGDCFAQELEERGYKVLIKNERKKI